MKAKERGEQGVVEGGGQKEIERDTGEQEKEGGRESG